MLKNQNKIFSVTSLNWSYLNQVGNDIKINNKLLQGNHTLILSILTSIISLGTITYISYKIKHLEKKRLNKARKYNKNKINKIVKN